jgi:Mlc titration factor MtfA (ptsG expression regulator)
VAVPGLIGRWLGGLRQQREEAAIQRRAIPDDLWKRTLVRFPFLQRRDDPGAVDLRRLTSLFLDRKEFSTVGGLRLSDAMVVAIAAQAVLPVLRLGLHRYDGFVGIVVHADQVRAPREITDEDGIVHRYEEVLAGETVQGGPVMLSWRDVRAAGRQDSGAYNVVIHEFAHVLDLALGEAGGQPSLPADLPAAEWRAVMTSSYEDFCRRVDAGEPTALDAYGAESPAEFFAVASEAFFVTPAKIQNEHPALYGMLVRCYLQDPVAEQPAPRRRA